MSAKTEKKLENLESDVVSIQEKIKAFNEKLREKKEKTEETRNLAIVEIVRENNFSIGELKAAINGVKLLDTPKDGQLTPVQTTAAVVSAAEKINQRKDSDYEEELN